MPYASDSDSEHQYLHVAHDQGQRRPQKTELPAKAVQGPFRKFPAMACATVQTVHMISDQTDELVVALSSALQHSARSVTLRHQHSAAVQRQQSEQTCYERQSVAQRASNESIELVLCREGR